MWTGGAGTHSIDAGRAAVSTPVDPQTRYGADGRGPRTALLSAPGSGAARRPGWSRWVVGPCGPLGRGRFGASCPPPSQPGALAVPLNNPLGAQSTRVRLWSPSSPRPNPAPTGRRLFPGRLLPPAIPRRDGFPLAGALLTVQSAESKGTPVVAARRVLPWDPRALCWMKSSAPPRRLALAGSRASRARVVLGEGHVPELGGCCLSWCGDLKTGPNFGPVAEDPELGAEVPAAQPSRRRAEVMPITEVE